jgi:hypothetical protein
VSWAVLSTIGLLLSKSFFLPIYLGLAMVGDRHLAERRRWLAPVIACGVTLALVLGWRAVW